MIHVHLPRPLDTNNWLEQRLGDYSRIRSSPAASPPPLLPPRLASPHLRSTSLSGGEMSSDGMQSGGLGRKQQRSSPSPPPCPALIRPARSLPPAPRWPTGGRPPRMRTATMTTMTPTSSPPPTTLLSSTDIAASHSVASASSRTGRDELRDGPTELKDALPVSNQKSSKVSLLDRSESNHMYTEVWQCTDGYLIASHHPRQVSFEMTLLQLRRDSSKPRPGAASARQYTFIPCYPQSVIISTQGQ